MEHRESEEAWQGAKELWLTGKSQPTPVTSYLASGVRQVNKIRWRFRAYPSGDESG